MKTKQASADLISIGTLASETGIHSSTLRVWEARYQAITPVRTAGGARRYSQEDVQRLKWIKALAGMGHKVRLLAPLSLVELKLEFDNASSTSGADVPVDDTLRLGSVGDSVWANSFFSHPSLHKWPDVAHVDDLSQLDKSVEQLDVIVVFTRALQFSLAKSIAEASIRNPDKLFMVVYEFSSAMAINQLRDLSVTCLKYPINLDEFSRHLISKLGARKKSTDSKNFLFSPAKLQSIIASEHNILCECPRHLADLLVSLHGFIDYSNKCADDTPRDAFIHKKLRDIAHSSISQLESGLKLALTSELAD